MKDLVRRVCVLETKRLLSCSINEMNTKGSVAVEYGLIAALIVLAIILSLGQVGDALTSLPLPSLIEAFEKALP